MQNVQLVWNITQFPDEYRGTKNIDMPESGGSIGRDTACTVTLVDNDRFISGSHCLIHVYGGTYYISDVSTNGTLVNGHRILKNQPVSVHDGDIIALGRYQIRLSFETNSSGQDIAADIVLQRETTDPLLCFEDDALLSENKSADLEALFMETRDEEIDKQDPIAHLDFLVTERDDFLFEAQNSPQQENKTPTSWRQIQDDTESLFAHFETPNFIPEDWEDLPRAAPFSNQPSRPSEIQTLNGQIQGPSKNKRNSKELEVAFFQGLGISCDHQVFNGPVFFQQMGACLSLCIDKLQRDLLEMETLKGTGKESVNREHLLELMLTLNAQNLLSPSELIEQILDELDKQKTQYRQAVSEAVCAELEAYDPERFANKCASQSRFISKKQLWRQYVDFFNHKSQQGKDSSAGSGKNQSAKSNE